MDTRQNLSRFLRAQASPELVGLIEAGLRRAQAAATQFQLPHLALELLEHPATRSRIPEAIRQRALARLGSIAVQLPPASSPVIGFDLAALLGPAEQIARDLDAARVSPLIFLATCLTPQLALDPVSVQAQEALRSAGLTLELLIPGPREDASRREDYTFRSLGFGTDLTAMASAGFWTASPLIGMESSLKTMAKLLNSGTGSAVLVGEPGVGKSAFVHGFAYKIVHRDRTVIPPTMDAWTVVMIEASDLLQGASGRGDLEARVQEMLRFFKRNPNVVPFFEEMHRLFDYDDPSVRSVATALKPPMANGLFRCVGCTTAKEYARFIAADEAMHSRFRKIVLPEPDAETAVRIIQGAKPNLLRGRANQIGVDLCDAAIRAAVRITSAYQRSDRLPRKAINLLSTVLSEKVYQLDLAGPQSAPTSISAADVARLFSEMSGIPVDALDETRADYYATLAIDLRSEVRGQPAAVDAICSWLALQSAGWVDQRRPRGRFLFCGPPGVGKTELASVLAQRLMQDRQAVIVLNMGDYVGETAYAKFQGASPGYVGFGATSTVYSRVLMRPYSVVILDEIEKCHASLANPLLSILDGSAEDSTGRWVDFSQCIIVMTSNSPATAYEPAAADTLTLDAGYRTLLAKLGGVWTRPLIDRIDRICPFSPLDQATLAQILVDQIERRRAVAAKPLPKDLDEPSIRAGILEDATSGELAASARGIERALLRWLAHRVTQSADVGVPAPPTVSN
jgi:ATP-dependent Clp protease ATP-binding subunit ClpA